MARTRARAGSIRAMLRRRSAGMAADASTGRSRRERTFRLSPTPSNIRQSAARQTQGLADEKGAKAAQSVKLGVLAYESLDSGRWNDGLHALGSCKDEY